MRDSHPQALFDVLEGSLATSSNTLQTIQRNAKAIIKLNRAVIEVANASWMTRLNYEKLNLLSALRTSILPSLSSIDIRINPDLMRKSRQNSSVTKQTASMSQKMNERQISTQTAQALLKLAENSPKGLKERFERLAALAGESTSATNRKG